MTSHFNLQVAVVTFSIMSIDKVYTRYNFLHCGPIQYQLFSRQKQKQRRGGGGGRKQFLFLLLNDKSKKKIKSKFPYLFRNVNIMRHACTCRSLYDSPLNHGQFLKFVIKHKINNAPPLNR